MTTRNLHRIAGALERMRHEAATGTCGLPRCTDLAVGYIESWDLRQTGVCEGHRAQGERFGYTVHDDPLTCPGCSSPLCPDCSKRGVS